jgi:hypothetical protein
VLKNAIDHASRPYGQSAWAGKPAAIIGVSVGAIGTALAQQHLRNILAYLDMPTLGQPEMPSSQPRRPVQRQGPDRPGRHSQVPAGVDGQVRRVGEGAREDVSRPACAGATQENRPWAALSLRTIPGLLRVDRVGFACLAVCSAIASCAAVNALARGWSPIARPSARTKRTSVTPRKPNTVRR